MDGSSVIHDSDYDADLERIVVVVAQVRRVVPFALALLSLVVSCSEGDDQSTGKLEIAELTASEHFRIIDVINFTYEALVPNQDAPREYLISFEGPDSWHIVTKDLEYVLIGDEAWQLTEGQWRPADSSQIRGTILSFVPQIPQIASADGKTFEGPERSGESTIRLAVELPTYGDFIGRSASAAELPPDVEAFTKELYRDVSGEAEFIVGAESGRVYEYILTLKGPNLSGELSLMFDYDSQVEIPTPR